MIELDQLLLKDPCSLDKLCVHSSILANLESVSSCMKLLKMSTNVHDVLLNFIWA
jgi:hypothetical protein